MPALVVPGAALVRLIWTISDIPFAVNVLGTRVAGTPTFDQSFANTVGASIKGSLNGSGMLPQLGPTVALANVGVRDIRTPSNAEFIDGGAAVPGSAAAGLLPPQVAAVVTLRTARAGKSFRGRVYLPGFAAVANDATGHIVPAVNTAATAFLESIRTSLPATGLTLCIVSRKNLSTEVVTLAMTRDTQWDTIRGRATPGI